MKSETFSDKWNMFASIKSEDRFSVQSRISELMANFSLSEIIHCLCVECSNQSSKWNISKGQQIQWLSVAEALLELEGLIKIRINPKTINSEQCFFVSVDRREIESAVQLLEDYKTLLIQRRSEVSELIESIARNIQSFQ